MARDKFIVEIIPHHYYFGLPSGPSITLAVEKITHNWWGFPKNVEKVFDTYNRDLFKCISDCNNFFSENNVQPEQVRWPDFCRYVKDYKE